MRSFNLQSFGFELGENTYMKEVVGYRVMAEAGVPAARAFHVAVMRNNRFYGLFAFVEELDERFLKVGGGRGVRRLLACLGRLCPARLAVPVKPTIAPFARAAQRPAHLRRPLQVCERRAQQPSLGPARGAVQVLLGQGEQEGRWVDGQTRLLQPLLADERGV